MDVIDKFEVTRVVRAGTINVEEVGTTMDVDSATSEDDDSELICDHQPT